MSVATVAAGADLHEGPDSTSAVTAHVERSGPVCAARESTGFGLRRVRLPGGVEGYVEESYLSR